MIFRIRGVKRAQVKRKTKLKMFLRKRIKMIKIIRLSILMKTKLRKNQFKKKKFKKMIKKKIPKKLSSLFQKC